MTDASDANAGFREGYRSGFRDGHTERSEDADKTDKPSRDGDPQQHGDHHGAESDHAKPSGKEGGGEGEPSGKDHDSGDQSDGKKPLYKRPLLVGGALLVLLLLIIAAILFWRHSRQHESTDDAFVDGQTSQIAAQVGGRVVELFVTDNQLVNAGDKLLSIDSRDTDARSAQAKSQLASAQGQLDEAEAQVAIRRASAASSAANAQQNESELVKAERDLARYREVDPKAVPAQEVDAALNAARSARAGLDAARMTTRAAEAQVIAALAQVKSGRALVAAARAVLATADLQGSYAEVVAPIRGRVSRRTVHPGNVIAVGQPLMAIVSENLWVIANYKETQLTRMRPGQSVEIVVDAYPDLKLRGHVDSIQRATGAYFSMLPAENATGNYVKVVQRVPVKIVFDDDRVRDYAIGPGMSVVPDVQLP